MTIQKRRAFKPLLAQLTNRQIKYRWSFPFQLSFTFKGKTYSFANFSDGEDILLGLGLISRESSAPKAQQETDRPISPLWEQRQLYSSRKRHPVAGPDG